MELLAQGTGEKVPRMASVVEAISCCMLWASSVSPCWSHMTGKCTRVQRGPVMGPVLHSRVTGGCEIRLGVPVCLFPSLCVSMSASPIR